MAISQTQMLRDEVASLARTVEALAQVVTTQAAPAPASAPVEPEAPRMVTFGKTLEVPAAHKAAGATEARKAIADLQATLAQAVSENTNVVGSGVSQQRAALKALNMVCDILGLPKA